MLKVLDLFSGIGGFSLGLERTGGFKTVAFCEIDPYCRKVLAKHWSGVPCYEDVTTREFVEGEADVVTGGFPCQDISYAGLGAGITGHRSGLYQHLIRAIRMVRPQYAIVENVAALLGRGMGTVLGDLASIGYDAEWHCIPASAVGAPHRRDRIWIVANPGSEQHEGCRAPIGGALSKELACCSDSEGQPAFTINDETSWMQSNDADTLFAGLPSWGSSRTDGEDASGQQAGLGPAEPCTFSYATDDAEISEGTGSHEPSWSWGIEPDVGRVAHGVPSRVDRLRSLGNAVVPQIPELIGRAILKVEEEMTATISEPKEQT